MKGEKKEEMQKERGQRDKRRKTTGCGRQLKHRRGNTHQENESSLFLL